jgi:tetratricopeptide (TPR) repeat protein
MIAPQDTIYIQRLQELNEQYGFTDEPVQSKFPAEQAASEGAAPEFENFAIVPDAANAYQAGTPSTFDFGEYRPENGNGPIASNGYGAHGFQDETLDAQIIEVAETDITEENIVAEQLTAADDIRLHKEMESIEFYFENGYSELAEKSLKMLELEFGYRPEIAAIREKHGAAPVAEATAAELEAEAPAVEEAPEAETHEAIEAVDNEVSMGDAAVETPIFETPIFETPVEEEPAEEPSVEEAPGEEATTEIEDLPVTLSMDLNELRSELGLEDTETPEDDGDYETHYQMAVAYQEMGLMEDAIKEFQDAINAATPSDGTRRFFQCANLLGHCFMEKGMPNLALMWFKRALETTGLMDEEKQGLWYELAHAYEADGDPGKAFKYFEKIYAENVDYRDVGKRLERLHVSH